MQNRLLLNLFLFAIVAILAGVIFFVDPGEDKTDTWIPLSKKDITQISIHYGDQIIELMRKKNVWQITQPISVEADQFRIDSLLNILTEKPTQRYRLEDRDLAQYQLKEPLASLVMNDIPIDFGAVAAIEQRRYVRVGQSLALLEDHYYPLISSGYKNLVRRYLLPTDTQIKQIKLPNDNIQKNEQGAWSSTDTDLDADTLKRFIDGWQYIQAFAVQSLPEQLNGTTVVLDLDNPAQTIEFVIEKTDYNTLVHRKDLGLSFQFALTAYDSLLDPKSHQKTETDNP